MGLQENINKLNPWFYPVKINDIEVSPGIGSTWDATRLNNRIECRRKLLVDAVVRRYNFRGKSVLELACNCGYWSSIYTSFGATSVLGIEGRKVFQKQAQLYWKYGKFLPKEQYNFWQGDITDPKLWKKIKTKHKSFDIVLCAGILYHIPYYRKVLNSISEIVKDGIIIDTRVGPSKEDIVIEPGDLHFNAIKQTRAKVVPNLSKMLTHLEALGFDWEILPVAFKSLNGLLGNDDYNKKKRVAIFAKRSK